MATDQRSTETETETENAADGAADEAAATEPGLSYAERHELFCTHAAAVLRGEDADADRVYRRIWPEHHLPHHVFLFALFTVCVFDHFGDDLDWDALDAALTRLRRDHPTLSPLKTEALVRVCYGEANLYFEVPASEHPASMWAVCTLATEGHRSEADLADLFDRVEDIGRQFVQNVFNSPELRLWPTPGQAP